MAWSVGAVADEGVVDNGGGGAAAPNSSALSKFAKPARPNHEGGAGATKSEFS